MDKFVIKLDLNDIYNIVLVKFTLLPSVRLFKFDFNK